MLLFLYGNDSFRSREKLSEIKNKFLQKTGAGSLPIVVDYDEKKEDIFEFLGAGGLFSQKSLLIVKNLLAKTEDDEREKILGRLRKKKSLAEDKNQVVVFWEKTLPAKTDLFVYLLKNSQSQNFEKLTGRHLSGWIDARIKKHNPKAVFSRRAAEKLAAYAGGDLFRLENEIQKLSAFREDGEITEADVEFLAEAEINSNIFETVDALARGDKKTALNLLERHLKQGDDCVYLLSMYALQFRNLLKTGEYFWQGMTDAERIARETRIHPFVAKKCLRQLRNFSFEKLKNIYAKLREMDWKIKTGRIDPKLALNKFIMEI